MKRPTNKGDLPADWKPSANVLIFEVPSETGADKVVESLLRDSARLKEAAPLFRAAQKRAEANQKHQHDAAARYEEIRKAAGELISEVPQLQRASANKLAGKLFKKFPQRGWSIRTIRRALKK